MMLVLKVLSQLGLKDIFFLYLAMNNSQNTLNFLPDIHTAGRGRGRDRFIFKQVSKPFIYTLHSTGHQLAIVLAISWLPGNKRYIAQVGTSFHSAPMKNTLGRPRRKHSWLQERY